MSSQYPYRKTLHNEYLGVSKVIRAMTSHELDWLVEAQTAKWRDQESRRRQQRKKEAERKTARKHSENLKGQAEEDTRAAQESFKTLRTILTSSLGVNLAIDWEQLLDRRLRRLSSSTSRHPKETTFAFNFSAQNRPKPLLRL